MIYMVSPDTYLHHDKKDQDKAITALEYAIYIFAECLHTYREQKWANLFSLRKTTLIETLAIRTMDRLYKTQQPIVLGAGWMVSPEDVEKEKQNQTSKYKTLKAGSHAIYLFLTNITNQVVCRVDNFGGRLGEEFDTNSSKLPIQPNIIGSFLNSTLQKYVEGVFSHFMYMTGDASVYDSKMPQPDSIREEKMLKDFALIPMPLQFT